MDLLLDRHRKSYIYVDMAHDSSNAGKKNVYYNVNSGDGDKYIATFLGEKNIKNFLGNYTEYTYKPIYKYYGDLSNNLVESADDRTLTKYHASSREINEHTFDRVKSVAKNKNYYNLSALKAILKDGKFAKNSEATVGDLCKKGKLHNDWLNVNKTKRMQISHIRTGAFTSKLDKRTGELLNTVNKNSVNKNKANFIQICDNLIKYELEKGIKYKTNHYYVYRFAEHPITTIEKGKNIRYILPFSTSTDIDFLIDQWVKITPCCLFILKVPICHPAVFLSVPDDKCVEGNEYINQEQHEITLAPSILCPTNITKYDYFNVVECDVLALDKDNVVECDVLSHDEDIGHGGAGARASTNGGYRAKKRKTHRKNNRKTFRKTVKNRY